MVKILAAVIVSIPVDKVRAENIRLTNTQRGGFQSPWIRFARTDEYQLIEGLRYRVSIPVDKVRANAFTCALGALSALGFNPRG